MKMGAEHKKVKAAEFINIPNQIQVLENLNKKVTSEVSQKLAAQRVYDIFADGKDQGNIVKA